MAGEERFKVFGVYLSRPVCEAAAKHLYDQAGVIELDGYFEADADSVRADDPGARATDALVSDLVSSFAAYYDAADFAAADELDPDAFAIVRLAAEPRTVADLRERFRAAATIQETDLRTVQTALFEAALDETAAPDGATAPDE